MSRATDAATHCCLLTPAGMGAIAVIRVRGPGAVAVVSELFRPKSGDKSSVLDAQQSHRLIYGRIMVDGETLDDVIVCASTTDDGIPHVDINAHGGIRVVERILMALQDRGVSVDQDEGRHQAVWPAANRIEAEAIEAIARAGTRRVVEFLLHQNVVLPECFERLARQADQDPTGALAGLRALLHTADACLLLVDGVTIAIVGPPNAGKSTLANRLLGTPRAIVSTMPGTTRDWVAEPTAIHGIPVTVVDTPGMGATADALEALAIDRGMTRAARADLRILVLDGSRELPETFFDELPGTWVVQPLLVVANKSDLPQRWGGDRLPPGFRSTLLTVSALRGDGLALLEDRVTAGLGLSGRKDDAPGLFTRRQRDAVAAILKDRYRAGPDLARRIRQELIGTR
ncbi:MAG TPA: GTPase [Phycisphaerae bacterium]|nr:GTPase [Phycisphaerae bacterium]